MELTIKSSAFILNYPEEYIHNSLLDGSLKSLLFNDIIEYMNNEIDNKEVCLATLAKLLFKSINDEEYYG